MVSINNLSFSLTLLFWTTNPIQLTAEAVSNKYIIKMVISLYWILLKDYLICLQLLRDEETFFRIVLLKYVQSQYSYHKSTNIDTIVN